MFGFSTVGVSGNSMSPAYNQGDFLLIRSFSGQPHTLSIGQVYLIQDPNREGVKLLKRLKETQIENGVIRYWVEGDNKESNDGGDDNARPLPPTMLRHRQSCRRDQIRLCRTENPARHRQPPRARWARRG